MVMEDIHGDMVSLGQVNFIVTINICQVKYITKDVCQLQSLGKNVSVK